MKKSPATVRHSQLKAAARLVACAALLALSAVSSRAQSPTDGSTPTGLTPGSPAGSYPLSDFDTVNLFNGSLNFRLPLLKIGGRGGAGYPVTLHVEKKWTVHKHFEPGVGNFYYADGGWWSEEAEGWQLFDAGKVDIRSARREQPAGFPVETLTRITFTAPDGTEYDLRDQATNGQPVAPQAGGFNRGRVFVTSDGSSATFLSDWDVLDDPTLGQGFYDDRPDGYLLLKDGTRFRVVDGKVAWMRDRNGNKVTFAYDINRRVTSVTDSLSRQVTIVYATSSVPYTEISFAGFGGAARTLRIGQTNLGSALRAGQTLKTIGQLFPELHGGGPADPTVVSYVELPDGRRYRLFYNSYAELARVELPTGGAVEYDHAAGLADGAASGVFNVYSGTTVTEKHVYRRVVERRVYPDGGAGAAYESRMTYSRPETTAANAGQVVSDSYDAAGALLARSRHYFYGSPRASFSQKPTHYGAYKDGREHKSEEFAADGTTVLRRVTHAFAQRAAVAWWSGDAELAPPNDPRLTETATTLVDTNQVSKQTFSYDQYNNQTAVYDYDFGAGAAGALLRRTHTDFVTAAAYVGADLDPAVGAHLRALPSQTWVSSDAAGSSKVSRTAYEYDNYADDARHKPLVARSGITGHDTSVYSTTFARRGNVTGVTSYADATAQTGGVTASTMYDVAGNPVKTVDARGHAATVGYADSFCNGAGCPGTSVPNTYAFPTSTTSPAPDPANVYGSNTALATSTKYDFWTGLVYSATDANGKPTLFEYGDTLNRPTAQVRPDGSRTDVEYGDAVGSLYVRVLADLDATRRTESRQYFDGLGRALRSFSKDGQDAAKPWLTTDTQHDALGRVWRVSNPYRSSGPGSAVNPTGRWAVTAYDALGRVTEVTTPDDPARDDLAAGDPARHEPFPNDAKVVTAYSGDKVMVTDQDGKRRISRTDAAGRLTHVWELTPADTATVSVPFAGAAYAGYLTSYRYDGLGNLRKVEQGVQARFFAYDSLGRLIRAKNPEQGAMGSDADFPALTDSSSGTANGQWSVGYLYDPAGNLLKRKDARNVTATYTYDALGRNTTVAYAGEATSTPPVSRYYDKATLGKGRPWKSEAAGVSRAAVSAYDAVGRPTAASQQFWDTTLATPAWGSSFNVSRLYDEAGHVTSQTYPSGRTVSYTYDAAGRPLDFSGTLGDGVDRDYATGALYDESGGRSQERLGTASPLYSKRFYNVRGQLSEVRLGTKGITSSDPGHWNRGAILNIYSAKAGWTESGKDNNGNLRKQMVYLPHGDNPTGGDGWTEIVQYYGYDSLNRLKSVEEKLGNVTTSFRQNYAYDRWGNRTIDAAATWNAPALACTASAATNRLSPPAGYTMTYDPAGNLTYDNYTGEGTRAFDAESRMTSAQFVDGQAQTAVFAYDAEGRRVKRDAGAAAEAWQVYGPDGELLAEYAAGAAPAVPQREYGYRGGELLVTLEAGRRVNVALSSNGATASASSTLDATRLPSAAINGDRRGLHWGTDPSTGSGWTDATANSYPDWVEVAFAGGRTIDEISVFGLQDNYQNPAEPTEAMTSTAYTLTAFTVQYWTGSAWATVPGGAVTGNTKVWRKFTFAPITTTKVRVLVSGAGTSHSRVLELEAWGGGAEARWLVSDHLGTPRMVMDAAGQLSGVSRHDYFPFGEEIGAGVGGRTTQQGYSQVDNVRQKFTGYERDDETGLDFAQARYYASQQGRFTSPDPLLASGAPATPQSWNRYAYAFNNPLMYTDPTGLINDYYIERDGYIYEIETDDSFDRFYYQDNGPSFSLIATLERNASGLVQFPDSGTGFNRYGTVDAGGTDRNSRTGQVIEEVGQGDHYLQPRVAAALFGLTQRLSEAGFTLSLGDMSSSNGSDPWQPGGRHHAGHGHLGNRSGLDVDFRYLNGDGVSFQSQTATTDSQFSATNNQAVFDRAVQFGFTVNYQGTAGNNPLTGPSRVGGHNDHGHIGFGDGSKVMRADDALANKLRAMTRN